MASRCRAIAGVWVGLKLSQGHGRIHGLDRRVARSRAAGHSDGFRHAAGRAQHPRRAIRCWRRRSGCRRASATPCSPSSAPTASTASSPRAAPTPKIGIITVGKSYLDVRQALDDLGIDEVKANDLGLRLYKIAAPWPLEPQGLQEFARGPRPHHGRRGKALAHRSAVARGALRRARTSRSASARRTSAATGCSRSRARSTPMTSPSPSAAAC